ncbi:MAG: hypothetical protein CL812_00545 [Confluentimicrobium sp.]|nr:hypothetical protein [Actibacterium sp.]|tara:strand:- start:341 stop:946 length:606 start_codon:yes stop_codon:yes gene_type:complete
MSDEDDPFDHWVALMNKGHGYAGVFNYSPGTTDKRIVERATIERWRAAIAESFDLKISAPRANATDPPDFHAEIAGRVVSIELMQMVDYGHKVRADHGETPFAGQMYLDMQWTRDRLIAKLNDDIAKKGRKYAKQGVTIDILVIHTAEPWLTAQQVETWRVGPDVQPHPNIRSASLLLTYEPGRGTDEWPVFMVYGDLTSQ